MSKPRFRRLAVVGLGLMGASLALAARRAGLAGEIHGSARRPHTRRVALRRRVVDRAFASAESAVEGADCVVFCLPVLATVQALGACRGHFASGCLITDVGSTKERVVAEARRLLAGAPVAFLGSHPMAGSEQTGLDAARVDLYDDATVILTPATERERRSPALRRLSGFWRALGGNVAVRGPAEHDRIVARTSHLPHLAAGALVQAVSRGGGADWSRFCGSGFLDTTRVAAGSADMWHDIVATNPRALKAELRGFVAAVRRLQRLVDRDDLDGVREWLADCRARRVRLEAERHGGA